MKKITDFYTKKSEHYFLGGRGMALDPLKRSRQRQGPSLAIHTIGVPGYFGSVQPPLSEIPGSAPEATNRANSITPRNVVIPACFDFKFMFTYSKFHKCFSIRIFSSNIRID